MPNKRHNEHDSDSCEQHEVFAFSLRLPNSFRSETQYFPLDIIGSKILSIGSKGDDDSILGISYQTPEGIKKEIIIEYDETGMCLID